MRRTELLSLLAFLATLVSALVGPALLAPRLLGRNMTALELLAIGVVLCGFALWRRLRTVRSRRRRLDGMRDSALW
jgi:hypothetical protein